MSIALTPAVRLAEVSKVYGTGRDAVLALDRVSLEVTSGEFLCIVGASGCGKSTLLSLMAGLERPTAGSVEVRLGRPALMFQESALLPWLTAWQNVELPQKLRRVPRQERRRTVQRLLDAVNLTAFANRRPHELSGGMRQRVALARALAQEAPLLLMDEPFAALDAITRDLLHDDLLAIWQANQLTIVFVTHNVHEAVKLGDRVVLLTSRPGRVARAWTVDLPRPRSLDAPAMATIVAEITQRLHQEVRHRGR
jgi:NitT/TauT family transport system ATP-binding protein